MPVPIRLNHSPEKSEVSNLAIDYSFLLQQQPYPSQTSRQVTASNADAALLFELWTQARKLSDRENSFRVDASVDPQAILRLKSRGFITGGVNEIKFTERGRKIVVTMALGETSRFAKDADKDKSYTEILASMDKRGKKGYRIPKYAANTSNCLRLS